MTGRRAGVLAVSGGVVWLAKVGLLLADPGREPTGGLAGLALLGGLVPLALVAATWGWSTPRSGRTGARVAGALGGLLALVLLVDAPIPPARLVLGEGWAAEETGVLLTGALALALGVRWLRAPARSPFGRRQPAGRQAAGSEATVVAIPARWASRDSSDRR